MLFRSAAEFIEKMDRSALKIDDESYEKFMSAAVEDLNHRKVDFDFEPEEGSLEASINEKLDIAEAKAEEIFLKAKEAFKVTGERANKAFSNFKESSLAKKSMEKFNRFIKEFKNSSEDDSKRIEGDKDQFWEDQLSEADKLSLNEGKNLIELIEDDQEEEKEEEKEEEEVDEKRILKSSSKDEIANKN